MESVKLLELGKKGVDYYANCPKGTSLLELQQVFAWFVTGMSKVQNIESKVFLEGIEKWVQQLEEHQ